ncbi:1423_t:CDS:2 [Gigaspora margarita]|uniref:1423_t:CDS:1 n=1 Tax=Gigaspora margarita TaxID=4874 RepID=A0ABM8W2J3_GIGMA|nr:1423_t:CDS:2 [Gigaspora margarita]
MPSKGHIDRTHTNSIGFATNANKFQIIYIKGSKLVANPEKEDEDAMKIAYNLKKNILSTNLLDVITKRRQLEKKCYIFGGQSFEKQSTYILWIIVANLD